MAFILKNITKTEAREIVERICKERNWPLMEPVSLNCGLFGWKIRTNAESIGANVEIEISRWNKKITRTVYLPR